MRKSAFCSPLRCVPVVFPQTSHPSHTVSDSKFSKDDWKARIEPHLSSSLQTVSEQITQTAPVQSWLQRASLEAADGLGQMSGMQGEMMGYMRMMEDLESALPELLSAIDELTEGCGTIDLHWRPLQPNFSRLYVDFDRDYTVKLFVRLEECTIEATRQTITTVTDALPQGEPFPNRPNRVTGLVARDEHGVGVRLKEHLGQDRSTYQTVTLLPPDQSPVESLAPAEAAQQLLQFLCSVDG